MKKQNKMTGILVGFFLLLGVLFGCTSKQLNQNGWQVIPDAKKEFLTIDQKDLGPVVKDAHLTLKEENGKLISLTKWLVKVKGDQLTITTQQPKQTKWVFTVNSQGVNASCSDKNAVFTGTAPAPEERIPARVKSQDNGVMYAALGLVSANNIHNLFDRKTDILIQFTPNSVLSRHPVNNNLMDLIIPVVKDNEITLIPDYYNKEVGLDRYQTTKFKPVYKPMPKRFKTAPTGWSSWYCYYMTANEADMVKETDALAKELKPYGLEYVQLDACYTRGEDASYLDWNKEAFPKGGKWLFRYILNKGLKPGLWLNAYGANYAKPACADKYPENFFLHDKDGKLSGACCTADRTIARLDYTNPEVMQKHLIPLFDTLVNSWGLKYLKAGGWGTWMDFYEKNKSQAYDSTRDSRTVYRDVLMTIREVMGDDNYLLGCAMHEVGCGFGLFDGSRTGGDDLAQWYPSERSRMSMQTYFRSLFGANYLNGICWWSDPDDVQLRPPLTMDEAKTIVTSIALSGQAYIISDFMADPPPKERFTRPIHRKIDNRLPADRLELYKQTMPAMPIHTMDLYPFRTDPVVRPHPAEFPKALDLKVNAKSGMYDVVAVYNWADEPASKKLSFSEDIGLTTGSSYLVYDFWNKELEGIFRDSIRLGVPKHGVRVMVIKPFVNDRPQLLATSRHISGAYSIKELAWEASAHTLSGTSATVAGAPYTLYIYMPEGLIFSKLDTNAKILSQNTSGRVIEITMQGQNKPVQWTLTFTS